MHSGSKIEHQVEGVEKVESWFKLIFKFNNDYFKRLSSDVLSSSMNVVHWHTSLRTSGQSQLAWKFSLSYCRHCEGIEAARNVSFDTFLHLWRSIPRTLSENGRLLQCRLCFMQDPKQSAPDCHTCPQFRLHRYGVHSLLHLSCKLGLYPQNFWSLVTNLCFVYAHSVWPMSFSGRASICGSFVLSPK